MLRFALLLFTFPLLVGAVSYDTSNLPYVDPPRDNSTSVAISVLTELKIVEGNPDGTFRPTALLNRAEFMKMVMGFIAPDPARIPSSCFIDVPIGEWFTEAVCRAKELGIVSGNAIEGVASGKWPFAPSRPVQYEEAVKVLVRLYGIPTRTTDGEWYARFLAAAEELDLVLPTIQPGHRLTRGEMARLTVSFYAYSQGELEDLRRAQRGQETEETEEPEESEDSEDAEESEDEEAAQSSSASSESSSSSSQQLDPLASDTTQRESILLLGETSPVLAAVNVFSDAQPINIDAFVVRLTAANSSVDSFLVYDHDAVLLGRATLDNTVAGNVEYRLNVKNDEIVVPKREEYSFYVRALLRPFDGGGTSGGTVRVSFLGIRGTGAWNNASFSKNSSDTFSESETARSRIIQVANANAAQSPLIPGTGQEVGAFRFNGIETDGAATLAVTQLAFQVEQIGGVTIANVVLRAEDNAELSCSISGSTVTCSSIPVSMGTIDGASRVLRLYADVTVPSGLKKAALRLTLNQPGSPSSAGAITWTDGSATYTWLEGSAPIAQGTYYSY